MKQTNAKVPLTLSQKTIDNRPITIIGRRWEEIQQQLIEEYGKSILISFVSKRKMGCVFHMDTYYHWSRKVTIDFMTAESRMMFLLKFGVETD